MRISLGLCMWIQYYVQSIFFVLVPPLVKVSPHHLVVRNGYAFSINCDVIGSPRPVIEWRKVNSSQLPSSLLVSGAELVSTQARPEYTGLYVCSARNVHGENSSNVQISVVGKFESIIFFLRIFGNTFY